MFLILNSSNLIVDISTYADYNCYQRNGWITCSKEEADAIYSTNTDKRYPMKASEFISDTHTLVEVDEIPPDVIAGYYSYREGKFYITEEKQMELMRTNALDDMAGIIIDQEYCLTLLELGADVNDSSL